ncbi:hydroquinone glucosyltransferase-like [Cynara cardunculus var. scolymus]|uniref:UDP-glucuronosyl/UDP-glucosyltransferase n=1 Tax=Cynara cardunculus var. scolymus TaxID=59895 RepID=A0A118JT17_CYNCS|nr:hydroquinone glucosyltransferase-like [Cynara cardunculus var. scolymus]KVH89994.1 UDP-glucuronosyl/UDP-glucosyltransferase [Cynara cardunculus var. scolymus]
MEAHIAIFPSPGMGHLIPLTGLAHRLLHLLHRRVFITFIIPTTAGSSIKPQNDILNAMPENVSSIFLPPVDLNDLPQDAAMETRILLTVTRSLPALRQTLVELTRDSTKRPSTLVVDIFGPPSFEIAKEFDISAYIFSTVSAMTLVTIFHVPLLDQMYAYEYRDLTEPLRFPGCVPIPRTDAPESLIGKKNKAQKEKVEMFKMYNLPKGILVNSSVELEPGAFKAMEEGEWCKPDVFPVGPLIRTGSEQQTHDGFECLKWLDKHPVGSVLFVSFGSGGTLSQKQLNELAFGLEQSGQRFLWVIKCPNEKANAGYFSAENHVDPFTILPDGFLDRVKDHGLVVSTWAPQVEILGHGSTGGFLTHCGWNSILESIVNGVVMIAWPLFADQKMNAVNLTDSLGVGCRVKVGENGLVARDEIEKCIRSLMEGEDGRKMRVKMEQLKEGVAMALSQDGSSTTSLLDMAKKLDF